MLDTFRRHWREYLLEGFGLGLFMISACGFGALLFHPASPVPGLIPSMWVRGALMGTAMGLTNILNIYAPWGRRSGAHLNPVVTLTFYRLGKVTGPDLAGYATGQFLGGIAGTGASVLLFHRWIADPRVNYVITVPGDPGLAVALAAEVVISFGMMLMVLKLTNTPSLARFTGLFAGLVVALYITFEAPLSGMSMNPARTLGSAAWAHVYTALWLYFVAPPVGMLLAAEVYRLARRGKGVFCAKYHHDNRYRCIFCHPEL